MGDTNNEEKELKTAAKEEIASLTEEKEQEASPPTPLTRERGEELEELRATIAEQETIIAEQEAIIEALKIKNKRLTLMAGANQREAVETEAPVRTKPIVEVDGTKWKFRFAGFAFEGVHYEAEDAALDMVLIRKILATNGQAILKQIF